MRSGMNRPIRLMLFVVAAGLVFGSPSDAEEAKAKKITYDEHLVPILRDKCFTCHNPDKKSGGLVLTTYTSLMEGGSSGKIVSPGDPDASSLYLTVARKQEPFMPPKGDKLADDSLELIRKWIAEGCLENAGSKAVVVNKPKFDISLSSAAVGKPEGPPPMPGKLPLDPVVRTPRANAVVALAASPWAPLVAVGGQKQVLLYHSETLELLGVLPFPEGHPQVLRFSRNGSLLLAGGGYGGKSGKVVVWSVVTGERIFQVGDEYDTVLAADISSDQTQIALGGPSKVVRVYSTKDGSLLYEMKKHTDWIYSIEFSPDSVLLATADRNGGVAVWETSTGREYVVLRGHSAAVNELSWRPDSNVLATASEDGTIRLWEMENGNQIKSWNAHGGGVQSVRFGHDSRLVSNGRDRIVKIWDQNGAQQRAFEAFADVGLRSVFAHDGGRVIASDWTGAVRVYNSADGKLIGTLDANPPTVAERIEKSRQSFELAKAKADQAQSAYAAASEALQKAQAELASAQKAVTDLQAAAKTAADAVPPAKMKLDQVNATLSAAQAALPVKDAVAKLLAESAAKAKEASAKMPDSKDLADFAAAAQAQAAKAAEALTAAQKAVSDLQGQAKAAADGYAAAQAAAAKASEEAAQAPKVVEAKQAAVKAAEQQANAAKAALDQAVAVMTAAKAELDKWTAAASPTPQASVSSGK